MDGALEVIKNDPPSAGGGIRDRIIPCEVAVGLVACRQQSGDREVGNMPARSVQAPTAANAPAM